MQTAIKKSAAKPPPSTRPTAKAPDIASASVADTLAALNVNPEKGLARWEVNTSRQAHGYNEVAAQVKHPFLNFLAKFWGVSAWMLELIIILSAVLGKYSDLAVVSAAGHQRRAELYAGMIRRDRMPNSSSPKFRTAAWR